MATLPLVQKGPRTSAGEVVRRLGDRRSPELIIALTGPMGSGVSTSSRTLAKKLTEDFGYTTTIYKVSEALARLAKDENIDTDLAELTGIERVARLQTAGNGLRQRLGNDVLARAVVRQIAQSREASGDVGPPPKPRRVVSIIDGLKHPAEHLFLETLYGKSFWLLGVFAPEEERRARLKDALGPDLDKVLNADNHQDDDYGQNVRDLFALSSFFLGAADSTARNNGLQRFLDVLFGLDNSGPNRLEAGMAAAAGAATRSACLSRQVGAAVYSSTGELLGTGWNDVPRFGGGLYDGSTGVDNRCYRWEGNDGPRCHNDAEKAEMAKEVFRALKAARQLSDTASVDSIRETLKGTSMKDILEFSRSVHAEMEALLSVARKGGTGLAGGELFTTTFPCHNCARHIVASGLHTVYFVEPYPKSRAEKLHRDSISCKSTSEASKVRFLQFEGFSPRVFPELFAATANRKEQGRPKPQDSRSQPPRLQPPIDSFVHYEQMVVADFRRLEEEGHAATPPPASA